MSKEVEIKIIKTVEIQILDKAIIPKGKSFSRIDTYYSNTKKNRANSGIFGYYNITELLHFINSHKGTKKDDAAFLKGIYKEGTSAAYAERSTDYLFFDIDIKPTENKELWQDAYMQARLLGLLEEFAVFVGRSNSGVGMFGAFAVKGFSSISDTYEHRLIAEAVYATIEELALKQGIVVKFDIAQGKFRQVRYIAEQKIPVALNENCKGFKFNLTRKEAELITGVKDFKYAQGSAPEGSARDAFNAANPLEQQLASAGLSLVSNNRYKYSGSKSSTSGEFKDGKYFNNSTTFSSTSIFDSFAMVAKSKNFSLAEMYKYINELGYRDKEVDLKAVKALVKPKLSHDEIFKICFPFAYKTSTEKREFLNSLDVPPDEVAIYKAYLKLKNLSIQYDETLKVKKWVSEEIDTILQRAAVKKKLIVVAETGTGKSTAFMREFTRVCPEGRLLFVVPLTAIADQLAKADDSIVKLIGGATAQMIQLAKQAKIVVATHEQAMKLLKDCDTFTHVVRDEIHSDIAGSSFKKSIELFTFELLKHDVIEIGLTGTASNIFREKGLEFYIVKIDAGKEATEITQYTDNRDSLKALLQRVRHLPKGSKALIRINSKDNILESQRIFLSQGFKDNEVVILDGSKERKKSADFKLLVEQSKFRADVKLVITTSVIDEGVSIINSDWHTYAFIENDYHPMPAPLKQGTNRFRNNVENIYHIRKSAKEQPYREYTSFYDEDYEIVLQEREDNENYNRSTYTSPLSNDKYKYEDGSPNPYALALKSERDEAAKLNNEEFNQYLELNYNVKIFVDENYVEEDVEVSKLSTKERGILRTAAFKDYEQDIKTAVLRLTSDKVLQQSLAMEDVKVFEYLLPERVDFVKDNLSFYEGVYRNILALDKIIEPVEAINQFLYKDNDTTGVLDSYQYVNQKVKSLNQIRQIEMPKAKHKQDREHREKLINFIEAIDDFEKPPTGLAVKALVRKLKVVHSQAISNRTLQDLITIKSRFMYDSNKTRYIDKENNPEQKAKIIKKWMLPVILNLDNTRPKLAKQLQIQFKKKE